MNLFERFTKKINGRLFFERKNICQSDFSREMERKFERQRATREFIAEFQRKREE